MIFKRLIPHHNMIPPDASDGIMLFLDYVAG